MTGNTVDMSVSSDGLRQLSSDIRAAEPVLFKAFQQAMYKGAVGVADDYKRRARSFSTRIPPTIVVIQTQDGAYVRAGGADAPHAEVLENGGSAGQFRHPVFGNREVWVGQDAHPAAQLALEANEDAIDDLADKAIGIWAAAAGFR